MPRESGPRMIKGDKQFNFNPVETNREKALKELEAMKQDFIKKIMKIPPVIAKQSQYSGFWNHLVDLDLEDKEHPKYVWKYDVLNNYPLSDLSVMCSNFTREYEFLSGKDLELE